MISKTCYFCKPVGKKECDACTNVTKSNFVGNADWLYIEQLEKENEELKKENSRWKMIQKEKKILIQVNSEMFTANNPFYEDEAKE